jgi:hypothetical protein
VTTTLVTALICSTAASVAYSADRWPTGERLRALVYKTDACLARIIDRENPGWDPLVYNGGSRWHPGDRPSRRSYGLPQAQPAAKMASSGADWRTNPFTQLAWMRSYVTRRYGSACAAWASWQRKRWY